MPRINIDEFVKLAGLYPVLDVRSPGEYSHAHIPGAVSLPLFTNEERKVVGTAYKQEGRQPAIKIGLDYFGGKMRQMVEEVEQLFNTPEHKKTDKTVLIYCWRGGMRSAGVSWLMELYGFKVYTLNGGYKAYRNWALQSFELPVQLKIVGGYTGSGKTDVLHEMLKMGLPVLDLEAIAAHKGSAFGGFDGDQPSQEMFENQLAIRLLQLREDGGEYIWVEDESRRIGSVNLPGGLWNQMRVAPLYFLDIPFNERLKYIVSGYGKYQREKLIYSIVRIQKRLGNLETRNAINHLLDDNYTDCFAILLKYYDKFYLKSLHTRDEVDSVLHKLETTEVHAKKNARLLKEL